MLRVQALTLGAGWLLYALTRGFVFDRYLVVWSIALPLAWLMLLPRAMLLAQTIVLAVVTAILVNTWMM